MPNHPRRIRGVARAAIALVIVAGAVAGSVTTWSARAAAAELPPVELVPVAEVQDATAMAVRSGDPALYVALQRGLIVRLRDSAKPETVLDVTALTKSRGEQGLLGLAFAPDGNHLYVHYSGAQSGETVIEEYGFDDRGADPTTRRVVLTLPQPQANHNGGQLAFGPDGALYIGLGDGGNGGDVGPGHAVGGNGQSLTTLLGKILRIDPEPSGSMPYTIPPDNPFANGGGRPEIFMYGLRNPWRFSFDRKNHDVWIGDVGQGEYEEITRVALDQAPGANLGWNVYEGKHPFREGDPTDPVMPQVETTHTDGNCSIIGGYVYRGRAIPGLRGWFVFSDYCNGAIKAAKIPSSSSGIGARVRGLRIASTEISSFGEDADGELYVLSQDRGVFKIVQA